MAGAAPNTRFALTSAVGVLREIDRARYAVHAVRIDPDGTWWLLDANAPADSAEALSRAQGLRVALGDPTIRGLVVIEPGDRALDVVPVDVLFPVLHGPMGEDGTLQGMAAMAGLACVGSGVLGSALGMDKVLMRQVFYQNDLPSVDFLWFIRKAWGDDSGKIIAAIDAEIGYPCFVKPANAGSSVGISKVKSRAGLKPAIDLAAQFDRKILVERGVAQPRELECAVLGNDQPVASAVGEVLPANEFYDYEAKYRDDRSRTVAPAEIPEALAKRIQQLAVQAYKALDCAGLGRVDFLLDGVTGDLFVNEINTIPGFTPISMYPQLWAVTGVDYPALITRLVELALERHEDLGRSKTIRE